MRKKQNRDRRKTAGHRASEPVVREIDVERMGLAADGEGMLDGRPAFVFNALPGERVEARITERGRSVFRAETVRVRKASPHRVAAACPAYGVCGGCNLMHLCYEQQLIYKQELVERAMAQIGGFPHPPVRPCLPSPEVFGYRHKVQMPVRAAGKTLRIGFFARDSRRVVPLDSCPVHCREGDRIYRRIRQLVLEMQIPAYHDGTRSGLLRHILIRTTRPQDESLVCLITAEKQGDELPALARALLEAHPRIRGVVQNINPAEGDLILGRETVLLAGRSFIAEEIDGIRLRIAAPSFFQVNAGQVPCLLELVRRFLDGAARGILLDAYCGVGLYSLCLAGRAESVIGIESAPDAVRDARGNARENQIANARFLSGRVEDVLAQIRHAHGVVLNPPRSGCEPGVLRALHKMSPERVVYVSCNPASLARDLKGLSAAYRVEDVQPVDLFPQTGHVETVAALRRRK